MEGHSHRSVGTKGQAHGRTQSQTCRYQRTGTCMEEHSHRRVGTKGQDTVTQVPKKGPSLDEKERELDCCLT